MQVSFEEISDNARLWVYQADRELSEAELSQANEQLEIFVAQWAAHGVPLQAAYKVFYNRFVILAVDENINQASGCSIDGSVRIIKALEHAFNINFFDRTKIAFKVEDHVRVEALANINTIIDEGVINENTLTFNNLIEKKGDLEKSWVVPAKTTWMNRYFN